MSRSKQAKEAPPSLLQILEEITHIVRRWTADGGAGGGDDQDNTEHHDDDGDVKIKSKYIKVNIEMIISRSGAPHLDGAEHLAKGLTVFAVEHYIKPYNMETFED